MGFGIVYLKDYNAPVKVKRDKKMGQMSTLYRDYIDHMQLCSRNDVTESDAWLLLDTTIKSFIDVDVFNKDYKTFKGKDNKDYSWKEYDNDK